MQAVSGNKARVLKFRPKAPWHVISARLMLVAVVMFLLGRGLAVTMVDAAAGVRFVAGKIAGCN